MNEKITWEEIDEETEYLFEIWVNGSEMIWAKQAWEALDVAGLTTYKNELGKSQVLIRLLALACIYRKFCHYAWGEGYDFSGAYYEWERCFEINPFRLGQLVGNEFNEDDSLSDDELSYQALEHLCKSAVMPIQKALLKYYKEPYPLIEALWRTNTSDKITIEDEYGFEDEIDRDWEEWSNDFWDTDIPLKSTVLNWIEQDMDIDDVGAELDDGYW